jgi:hypothetical protein
MKIRLCKRQLEINPMSKLELANCRFFDCHQFDSDFVCQFAFYIEIPLNLLKRISRNYVNKKVEKWATGNRFSKAGTRSMNSGLKGIKKIIIKELKEKGEKR